MTTERALIEAAQAGDHSAFARLVEQYQRPVFSLAYRMLSNRRDAEDAAQESFLKAYGAIGRYDNSRPFSTWLLAVTAHHCIDRLRRRRLKVMSLDVLPPWRYVPVETVDPEHAAVESDRADHIAVLLDGLPDEYRLVLVLRYWHDLGYAEIADMLDDTESAVKSRLHRARRHLAERLVAEPGPGTGKAAGADPRGRPAPASAGAPAGAAAASAVAPAAEGGMSACAAMMPAS